MDVTELQHQVDLITVVVEVTSLVETTVYRHVVIYYYYLFTIIYILFDTSSVISFRSLCTELIILSHSCFCSEGRGEQTDEVVYAEPSDIPVFESAQGEK